MMYYAKAYALLIKRIVKGQTMPFHSKDLLVSEMVLPQNKKYLHNGILRTAKMIAKGKCRLHWLR